MYAIEYWPLHGEIALACAQSWRARTGSKFNTSVPGSFVYSPAVGTIPAAGTDTLSVTFTPTDTTDYTSATATVSLAVGKATPAIAWATPAAITYGTALSAAQLNAIHPACE